MKPSASKIAWAPSVRRAWQAGLGLLLFGAALYPITAAYGKINDRFDRSIGPTLDGTAYTQTAVYADQGRTMALRHDMAAIRWLQENVAGSPVILETNTPLYRWGSRVSIYTGLPTVIGWDWHQKQQRAVAGGELIDWRLADVRTMYDSTNEAEVLKLLRLYNVSYVYVGELERAYHQPPGLAKFDAWAGRYVDVVYRQGPVTIYKVRKESLGGLSSRPFRLPQAGSGDRPLLLSEPVDRLPLVDDRGWNPVANAGPLMSTAAWWLALSVLGWAAWPLCLGVAQGLPDHGYLVAKAIGWLLLGYVVWLGASTHLLANRVPHIYGALALLVTAGAWAGWRQRRHLAALWRARRGLLLREELLFSGAFLAFVAIRALNPDLWQPWFGGEKMMEFAYLNAIVKSAHFPPYDPYFAGGYINYYYYGLYLVNVLIKLTGVVPQVAFNLAVPGFFALTVAQAFSFGHAVTARLRGQRWLVGGWAAAIGVAVMGNLTVLVQWLASLVTLGGGTPHPEVGLEALAAVPMGLARWLTGQGTLLPFDYWYQATRVIPYTINEFPFFSFLFADLHPHMMAIPFTIAALVLAAGLLLGRGTEKDRGSGGQVAGRTRHHESAPQGCQGARPQLRRHDPGPERASGKGDERTRLPVSQGGWRRGDGTHQGRRRHGEDQSSVLPGSETDRQRTVDILAARRPRVCLELSCFATHSHLCVHQRQVSWLSGRVAGTGSSLS